VFTDISKAGDEEFVRQPFLAAAQARGARWCGSGGLEWKRVERPARSAGCETERTLKPGTTGWCWQVLLNAPLSRQKCAADILVPQTQFYSYYRPDEHPPNLLVRLTGILNIMWLYVKGDQDGRGFAAGIVLVTWTIDFIRNDTPFRI